MFSSPAYRMFYYCYSFTYTFDNNIKNVCELLFLKFKVLDSILGIWQLK